jgi:ribose transport system substrate-binding protein
MPARFLFALLLACVLTGCGSRDAATSAKKTPKGTSKGTIGVSVLTLTNPFFKVIGDTITEELTKHGYEVVVVSGEQIDRQQKQVEDFLVSKVAAIVLCPRDSRAIGEVIQKANQQGVPVFTADIACLAPDAKVVCHVATDNYAGGKQAAQAMIEALGDSGGKIAILDYKEVESCILRVKGFKEVIEEHNNKGKGKITIVKELPSGGDKAQGYKSAADALQSHDDLAGIFAINDPSALGARAALEHAKRAERVKIIGFDGQPEGKQAIKEGKIYADPIQYPDKIGRETAKAILRYFDGDPPPAEILIPTGLYRQADAVKELRTP